MEKLNEQFIINLSNNKKEPIWMKAFRLNAYKKFLELDNPNFGPKINIDFNNLVYHKGLFTPPSCSWENVSKNVKDTFNNLGVIDAEKKYLKGVSNQYESEVVYHKMEESNGIIFLSTDEALKKYPEIFEKYFNNLVKYDENKYTALNSALWSGGSFIYIPPYTNVDRPLQSYFRIDTKNLGQFERTIIIVDHDSSLHYIEGCTAKNYSATSLHAGVVEIYVGKNSKCKYSTIQNWSKDVYNLVTKRCIIEEGGFMQWVDGNIGSGVTMKYPSCILKGDNSSASSISIAYAKEGQHLDAGAKMIHLGKNTKSTIISKSISSCGGISDYRGTVKISSSAVGSNAIIKCDNIILDDKSSSNTYPKNIVLNNESTLEHEATISKINEEKFVESFVRRFAENVSLKDNYRIEIYDINEEPPKVSLKVYSNPETNVNGEVISFNISNSIDAILETKF